MNSNDDIFKCKKPCHGAWVHVAGKLKQIDGGHDYVYGVNSYNDIFTRKIDGSGGWRHIPGKLIHITASGRDEVFGVNKAGQIFCCKRPCVGEWELMSGALTQCDATVDGLMGVNGGHHIWKRPLPY